MQKVLKYKKWIILAVIVLLVVFFIRGRSSSGTKTVAVRKTAVENRVVTKTVSATGEVKSEYQADLSFAVSQKLTKLYVAKGANVTKGTLLALVENQSSVQTAQSYKDSRDIALRQRELFEKNKEDNIDELGGEEQYEIKLREYNEEVSKAEAAYNSQLAVLKNTYIYSPYEGTIVDILKDEGEIITAGETIIKIADLNKLFFSANVDQEDFGHITKDMGVKITLDGFPDSEFSGNIFEIPVYLDNTSTNTFTIKSSFKDLNDIKPILGMTGDIKIVTKTSDGDVKSLYYDEIFEDDEGKNFVWVIENGTIAKEYVNVVFEGDIYTQIDNEITKQIVIPVSADTEVREGYKGKVAK